MMLAWRPFLEPMTLGPITALLLYLPLMIAVAVVLRSLGPESQRPLARDVAGLVGQVTGWLIAAAVLITLLTRIF